VLVAVLAINDPIRPQAFLVIANLLHQGIDVYMITGDHERTANYCAAQLGIPADNVFAQVRPGDKERLVREVQAKPPAVAASASDRPAATDQVAQKPLVMFVGDGINDSPALAQADIGVAIGQGTDVAIETANLVLMRSDLTDVLTAIHMSKTVLRRVYYNFAWAFVYNLVSIPFAAGMFFPFLHMRMNPAFAALAMAFSSISVVLSSLMLKWYVRPVWKHVDPDTTPRQQRAGSSGRSQYRSGPEEDVEMKMLSSTTHGRNRLS
jgi:Cu+-exporting ATPase